MCFFFYLSSLVFTEFFQCEGWGVCVCVCVCVCTCARMHVHSVVSDSLCPHGLKFTRLLCPWNFPGKKTGVDCHFLLQGIFLVQGWSLCLLCLLHWQVCLLLVEPPGSPCMYVCLLNWLAGFFFFFFIPLVPPGKPFYTLRISLNFCPALDILWVGECLLFKTL